MREYLGELEKQLPKDANILIAHTMAGGVPRELGKHALTLLGSMPDLEMLNVQAEKLAA